MQVWHIDFAIVINMFGNPYLHIRCWSNKNHWCIGRMSFQQPQGNWNVVNIALNRHNIQ